MRRLIQRLAEAQNIFGISRSDSTGWAQCASLLGAARDAVRQFRDRLVQGRDEMRRGVYDEYWRRAQKATVALLEAVSAYEAEMDAMAQDAAQRATNADQDLLDMARRHERGVAARGGPSRRDKLGY